MRGDAIAVCRKPHLHLFAGWWRCATVSPNTDKLQTGFGKSVQEAYLRWLARTSIEIYRSIHG